MFIDGLGEITESINAGKSSSKSTGIIGEESISLQTETTDYTKKLEYERANRAEINRQKQQYSLQNSATRNGMLKRNTILPGYYVEGSVIVDYQFSNTCLIDIPFGDEHHVIDFVRVTTQ